MREAPSPRYRIRWDDGHEKHSTPLRRGRCVAPERSKKARTGAPEGRRSTAGANRHPRRVFRRTGPAVDPVCLNSALPRRAGRASAYYRSSAGKRWPQGQLKNGTPLPARVAPATRPWTLEAALGGPARGGAGEPTRGHRRPTTRPRRRRSPYASKPEVSHVSCGAALVPCTASERLRSGVRDACWGRKAGRARSAHHTGPLGLAHERVACCLMSGTVVPQCPRAT